MKDNEPRDLMRGDALLSVGVVARYFKVDPKTVSRWAAAGRFPDTPDGMSGCTRTAGRHWRVRQSVALGLLNGTLAWRETR